MVEIDLLFLDSLLQELGERVCNSGGASVLCCAAASVFIETVNLVIVVVLGWYWRHVLLLTLWLVLRFFHLCLDLMLQELGVLLEHLQAQPVQLHRLP